MTKSIFICLVFLLQLIDHPAYAGSAASSWEYISGSLKFSWNLETDHAVVTNTEKHSTIWQGSLLPSYWILDKEGKQQYLHAHIDLAQSQVDVDRLQLAFILDEYGKGTLSIEKKEWGIQFSRLTVEWKTAAPAIIEMYFGTEGIKKNALVHALLDLPFKPDWQSSGYCIPGAKGGTVQSYFRNWDFGQADIALGNYGPSLGTPYGAAYPRPLLYSAMGSNDGWINIGVGSLPDAALCFKIQSTKGCFKYVYREDLWGAMPSASRIWEDPLRITLDATAPDAFVKYYSSFPVKEATISPKALWNTWGMWQLRKFPMKPMTDFATKIKSEIYVLDDSWESAQGSGKPNLTRFPEFDKDIQNVRSQKMEIGVWETIGWISDTIPYGLGSQDLILDKRGLPCKTNWNFDDAGQSYYCLDVSSPKVQAFLKERTTSMMKTLHPSLIKLDFGYALPSPHMGVPRNPAYRGERYAYELIRLIVEAAKQIDPKVIIMNYGTTPLYFPVTDIVSLDDQGDLWYELHRGHQEWSIWASLIGARGMAVTGSSSYNWNDDAEVLMNTAIIGVPGACLALTMKDGKEIPEAFVNRRLALNKYYRRTMTWSPRWFNSHKGDLNGPPRLNCWGREEEIAGKKVLTALTLRPEEKELIRDPYLQSMQWTGTWSLIAQDNEDLSASKKIAVIPFGAGKISFPSPKRPSSVKRENTAGQSLLTNWVWEKRKLTINLDEKMFSQTGAVLVEW